MNGGYVEAKINLEEKWNSEANLGLVLLLISDEISVTLGHLDTTGGGSAELVHT